jgi:hypothetical protein
MSGRSFATQVSGYRHQVKGISIHLAMAGSSIVSQPVVSADASSSDHTSSLNPHRQGELTRQGSARIRVLCSAVPRRISCAVLHSYPTPQHIVFGVSNPGGGNRTPITLRRRSLQVSEYRLPGIHQRVEKLPRALLCPRFRGWIRCFVVFWPCFRAFLERRSGRQPLFQQAVTFHALR